MMEDYLRLYQIRKLEVLSQVEHTRLHSNVR